MKDPARLARIVAAGLCVSILLGFASFILVAMSVYVEGLRAVSLDIAWLALWVGCGSFALSVPLWFKVRFPLVPPIFNVPALLTPPGLRIAPGAWITLPLMVPAPCRALLTVRLPLVMACTSHVAGVTLLPRSRIGVPTMEPLLKMLSAFVALRFAALASVPPSSWMFRAVMAAPVGIVSVALVTEMFTVP